MDEVCRDQLRLFATYTPGNVLCCTFSTAFVLDENWGVCQVFLPEDLHQFLSFFNIPNQVVSAVPFHKGLHFLSVVLLIVISKEATTVVLSCRHGLNDVVCAEVCTTGVGHQSEEEGPQNTPLWRTCAQ